MQTLQEFLAARNQRIKEQYTVLVQDKKQKEAIADLSRDFNLSKDSIYTIAVRNNKNRAN